MFAAELLSHDEALIFKGIYRLYLY